MRVAPALFALALVLAPGGATALDPERRLYQYHHSKWTGAEGAPTSIHHIVQTPDGHLLIGAGRGLFRFDGWRFENLDSEVDRTVHGGIVDMLMARSGGVWLSYRKSGQFAIYRNGRLRFIASPPREGEVIDMAETPDGAIWAGIGETGRPLLRYSGGKWQRVRLPSELGRDQLYSLLVSADGALWLSYRRSVLRLPLGSNQFQQVLGAPYSTGRLSLDPQGRVWVSETRGSHPISGPAGRWPWKASGSFLPTEASANRRGKPMFDRDGNFWLATRTEGLERVARLDVEGPAPGRAEVDRFGKSDGLSVDTTSNLFEDREGTIWVATVAGLDRFRQAAVNAEAALTKRAAFGDILLSASDGSVYIAQASIVYHVAPHGSPQAILTNMPEPEAMCEGPDRTIWMVFADRVVAWRGGSARRMPRPSPAEEGIYDCAFDSQGKFWMSAADNGLYVWEKERWRAVPQTTGVGLRHTAIVTDRRNEIWMLSARAALRRLNDEPASQLDLAVAGVDEVKSVYASTRGLLVSAVSGIGELRGGHFSFAKGQRVAPLLGATGLVETSRGEIWAMSSSGLIRTSRAELERAFVDPSYVLKVRRFSLLDGLANGFSGESIRSVVQGGDGRIWMATAGGTVWVDPARIPANPVPPPVAVTLVEAGETRHRDPGDLTLAAGTGDVVFNFSVLSYAMPERAQVRYRLHGYDGKWIDPETRRQAFYTNLPPGTYRFQVIAANEDGVWNNTGAEVALEIPPTFFQSRWFTLLCVLAGLAALWLLYKVRIRQVGRRIRAVLEERLAERERIARELHDTLLQSVQGLILSFQAATEQLQPDDPRRDRLERTLKRADDVLAEGRDRVHLLRAADGSEPLDAALERLVQECGLGPSVSAGVLVTGTSRPVPRAVVDEVAAIAGEALRNIVRHAQATAVKLALEYGANGLTLSIADNGVGLPPAVHAVGSRAGHFGLTGMRERAAEIGGTCSVESAPGAGTTITVRVPATIAFPAAGRSRLQTMWSRVRPQEAHA